MREDHADIHQVVLDQGWRWKSLRLLGMAEQSNPEIEHREAKRFCLQCHELVENLTPGRWFMPRRMGL
jgi:hypothetical protein